MKGHTVFIRGCRFFGSKSTASSLEDCKKSFDLDLVMQNYEARMEAASAHNSLAVEEPIFSICLPPPNVTGKLHLGHALTVTIEDVICRYHRSVGYRVKWYPGFDHAGIATQTVVEQHLWKTKRLRRHQLSRDRFIEYCEKWKDQRISEISSQLRNLGATLNWNETYYTMDKRFTHAVTKAFCDLYSKGLIFRDCRVINWCPTLQSTISDQEVNWITVDEPTTFPLKSTECGKRSVRLGTLYKIRYPLAAGSSWSSDFLEVATTRPETVFADVALAVNTADARFAKFIGQRVRHPLINGRFLPVIGDEAVKPEKGTGVVKITPCHSFIDFEIGLRHKKELDADAFKIPCIDDCGRMVNAEEFTGIDRFLARDQIIDKLRAVGNYGGEMFTRGGQIPLCSRTGDVIEPMIKQQWFMRCDEINRMALRSLNANEIVVTPSYARSQLEEWFRNEEPWCLSRQLFWGHRIPAFRSGNECSWIIAPSEEAAMRQLNLPRDSSVHLHQDIDVLDTWFSSSLVPLVMAGWPEKAVKFPPLSLMETGYDIAGIWVARMISVTQQLSGVLPFQKAVFHGLVRDSSGRKMSKSLGNVIDPMDIVNGKSLDDMVSRLEKSLNSNDEKAKAINDLRRLFPSGIKRYGIDALRFALLRCDTAAQDISLDVISKTEEGYRFCNKLWNLCSYTHIIHSKADSNYASTSNLSCSADQWIKSRLAKALREVQENMNSSSPHLAVDTLYRFIWNDLCDVYLETTKSALRNGDLERLRSVSQTLSSVVQSSLKALAVFMPFVCEYLFEHIKLDSSSSVYDFPNHNASETDIDDELEKRMAVAVAAVTSVRSLKTQLGIKFNRALHGTLHCDLPGMANVFPVIEDLANVMISGQVAFSTPTIDAHMPLSVAGFPASISILLDEKCKHEVHERLQSQLKKAVERRAQFELKAAKYEKIMSDESARSRSRTNAEKKCRKAQEVVWGMNEEIAKINLLLKQSLNMTESEQNVER
ncbi:hypothetical protein AB6A40_003960 [Gnathostoma spinigerum]|uniref:valine--tRNA ligase n=1 Tax=Gnathostoma spinigerum TaxID=75299 RepID=A0ABD6EDG7_9BILA